MNNFYKKKLANGLTVLFEKRKLPVVSVSASVRFGSIFESEKNKGISHFVEHLMFKGTKTRKQEEIAREVEKKGGILNAYTSEEVTSYWNKLPSRHFKTGINIASDLILNPRFDAVEFEKEKNVIIEEIKMYHDNPQLHVLDKIKQLLYQKPFGMSIAGKEKIIREMKIDDVKNLHKTNYTSDSMILTVVGDADFSEVCNIAEKIYPRTKRNIKLPELRKINREEIEKRKGLDQSHFVFGFHSPTLLDKKKYAYEVGGAYLFGGMSSRFFQEIREKRGLVYAIKGDFDSGKNYGYCYIYAGTSAEKIKEIKEIIVREIKELKNMKNSDFEECKEQLIGTRKLADEDSSNVMNSLMLEEAAGNAEEYYNYDKIISEVKLQDVRDIKLRGYSSFSLIPE